VPEVIVARHMGMAVFGISVITNAATPSDPDGETTHEEVQDVAASREPDMTRLVEAVVGAM
jgi:purine-nucleoside phosphorylase